MNKRQKLILIIAAVLIVSVFIVWLTTSGEILTKTQVLVDKTTDLDKMLGVKNEVWEDKIILGLDYTLGFSGAVMLVSGILFFIFKNKNIRSQNESNT
jgi:hypothetical protein